jgi:hypothetical protein
MSSAYVFVFDLCFGVRANHPLPVRFISGCRSRFIQLFGPGFAVSRLCYLAHGGRSCSHLLLLVEKGVVLVYIPDKVRK